jgi:hypothetical protein
VKGLETESPDLTSSSLNEFSPSVSTRDANEGVVYGCGWEGIALLIDSTLASSVATLSPSRLSFLLLWLGQPRTPKLTYGHSACRRAKDILSTTTLERSLPHSFEAELHQRQLHLLVCAGKLACRHRQTKKT